MIFPLPEPTRMKRTKFLPLPPFRQPPLTPPGATVFEFEQSGQSRLVYSAAVSLPALIFIVLVKVLSSFDQVDLGSKLCDFSRASVDNLAGISLPPPL